MVKNRSSYGVIMDYMEGVPVFDTHEHLEPLELRTKRNVDVFNTFFYQYISSDLVSSGMSKDDIDVLLDDKTELESKWDILYPHLPNIQNTANYRAIRYVFKDIFGIDKLDRDTYRIADGALKKNNDSKIYNKILQDKCNIKFLIWDNLYEGYELQLSFTRPVFRIHEFVFIENRNSLNSIETRYNTELDTLTKYIGLIESIIAQKAENGYIGLKNATAYLRKLYFEYVSRAEAEGIYLRLHRGDFVGQKELAALQDCIMHEFLRIAAEWDIPMQIHTGLHAGNGNHIKNSNPADLTNIFLKYPGVRFDLFHGGYPYGGELSAVVKNFPNVFLDMSWLYAISPGYAERYLNEWLETVPLNKIFGFGGDYVAVEMVYGQLKIAKETIAKVLSNKVDNGRMSLDYAKTAVRKLLYQNPSDFYRV